MNTYSGSKTRGHEPVSNLSIFFTIIFMYLPCL